MLTTILDKEFKPELEFELGKIGIRVVVFAKKASGSATTGEEEVPLDLNPDEDFSSDDSAVNSYLEFPKRGKLCCVFLINGQRHHGLDNSFIVNDLKMKYLRKRMMIVVDLDGLSMRAINEIMHGSRGGFFEGTVYQIIRERLVATLQDDPDLGALEEEAEDELSQLQAGDLVVQQALDELIDQHFSLGDRATTGADAGGGQQGQFFGQDGKPVDVSAIVFGENGEPASGPVLVSNHAAPTLRLVPNAREKMTITALPKEDWQRLKEISVTLDPATEGLTSELTRRDSVAELGIEFAESADAEPEEYPIEATLRVLAMFEGETVPRLLEKNVIVRPRKPRPPPPPPDLKDTPTFLRVSSRQPIRLLAGGPDAHVRLAWNGKDSLTLDPAPEWMFQAHCKSHPEFPSISFSKPTNGRFEALVHTPADYLVGTKFEFEVVATGPGGAKLSAVFLAEAVIPPGPKAIGVQIPARSERRPPYKLVYIFEKDFGEPTRWGAVTWTADHAAAFVEPTAANPLTLCINQDFALLKNYVTDLVSKKADEKRLEEKKTKYTSHVAYHLYQMYLHRDEIQKKKKAGDTTQELHEPQDEEMQLEINRVSSTLIRLMEVMR